MEDFNANQVQEISEGLEFANFLQDPSAANGVLQSVQEKFPNALSLFMHNTSEYLATLKGTMSVDEIDKIFNYQVNNFILIMHILDMANGGEQPDMENIPEEVTTRCNFGTHTLIGRCKNEGVISTKIMDEEINLCEDCAKDFITYLMDGDKDAIVRGLMVLPIGAIIQSIVQEMTDDDKTKYYLSVMRGELSE